MKCRICVREARPAFEGRVLGKHLVAYHQCPDCLFLQTEAPHWLAEAYDSPINLVDTGILARNLLFSRIASTLIYFLMDKDGLFLDYAGGYGTFTRFMRDIGFDFRWHDPYTENHLARGFEYRPGSGKVELLTSFESFEHFVDPLAEVGKMLAISRNILFSTELLPEPAPALRDWWYYGPEHGQHVSFYSRRNLEVMAKKFGLNLCTNGRNLHLFTEKRVSPALFALLCKLSTRGLFQWVKRKMPSRTMEDMKATIGADSSVSA